MINYSFYPILEGAKTPINDLNEQTILYCKENIEQYKPTPNGNNLAVDIPIWLTSTIILHNTKNKFLIRKFVNNYGKTFESKFLKDFYNKSVREEVLYHFNVTDSSTVIIKTFHKDWMKIKMNDYLEIQQAVSGTVEITNFALVNVDLDQGYVHMEVKRFVYLCRLLVEKLLYNKIYKEMKDYTENELINEVVNKLTDLYPKNVERVQHGNNSTSTVPESIQQLITKIYEEHHIGHQQRIKLGLYLLSNNFEWDYIINIFKELSDFNLNTTTYQLNSLRKYIKPQ